MLQALHVAILLEMMSVWLLVGVSPLRTLNIVTDSRSARVLAVKRNIKNLRV